MNVSSSNSSPNSGTGAATAMALQSNAGIAMHRENLPQSSELGPRHSGYGLPCSKCRTYYAADVTVCPVCKSTERVSPVAVNLPVTAAPAEPAPDLAVVEEERERFLLQFKSEIYAEQANNTGTESSLCTLTDNHEEASETASICKSCYQGLQERADLLEAALHIDLKEASQIIYDAVWADPSDPSKTYLNAAQAIVTELRKRAGISAVMGPMQKLPH